VEELARPKEREKPADAGDGLDRVLDRVEAPRERPLAAHEAKPAVAPSLRMARVLTVAKRAAEISFRGGREKLVAAIAEEVETELVTRAAASHELVLVEVGGDAPPLIVGVVQTRSARDLTLQADTITLEGHREILLKCGRSALRLREDGDVELVGSRIVTTSRGLLRLVGRMLRLN
jgi:hypothetical protein